MPYNLLRIREKSSRRAAFAVLMAVVAFSSPGHSAPMNPAPSQEPVAAPSAIPSQADTQEKLNSSASSAAVKPEAAPASPGSLTAAPSFGSYLSGRFAESQGDTSNGIHFLTDSLKRDPKNTDMLASLYRQLILAGKIEEAIPVAQKLSGTKVVEDGSEFSPEMLLAVDKAKKGEYAESEKHLASIPKVGFNSLLVPLMQAWLKVGEKTLKSAVDAKDLMPGDAKVILPHVYLNAAFINDIAGFDAQAQKQYEAAVKDTRVEPFRAVEALANYYARKGMKDKREKLVDDYLAAHGESFLADELLLEPAGEHPAPLVKDATEGLAEVFYTMANIFHGVRAPADEIATLHLALYLRPDFPTAQFLMASAYELAQDYPTAIETYKAIDKNSPYYARGRIRGIYDESEMGNKEEALNKINAIIAENPNEIDALLAKGDLLRSQERFKEAVETYDSAISHIKTPQKRHWIIYFSRGVCYERIGQWDKAELDIKKALELSPGEPDALNYLGYSWLEQHRNLQEAKKMIEEAYDARPEDANIIDSMGYALYMTGDFASAAEYFEQAVERMPDDVSVNDHLGDTYWQLGRKTEARYEWQRALDGKPDAATEKKIHKKIQDGIALIHSAVQVSGDKEESPDPDANTSTSEPATEPTTEE